MASLSPVLCSLEPGFHRPFHGLTEKQKEVDDRMLLSALLTGNEQLIDDSISLWIRSRIPEDAPLLAIVLEAVQDENRLFATWAELFENRHKGFRHQTEYVVLNFRDIVDESMRISFERFRRRMRADILFLHGELKSIHSCLLYTSDAADEL